MASFTLRAYPAWRYRDSLGRSMVSRPMETVGVAQKIEARTIAAIAAAVGAFGKQISADHPDASFGVAVIASRTASTLPASATGSARMPGSTCGTVKADRCQPRHHRPMAPCHPPKRREAAMRIELRKVSYSERLSEETAAFSAEIWIDGHKAGQASNHGQGGATMIGPQALQVRLDEYGKTLPVEIVETGGDGEPMRVQPDGEWIVGGLLTDWLLLRDMKRDLRNRLLYTRTDKPGIYRTTRLTPTQFQHALGSVEVRATWNVGVFLNILPESEALALYRKQGVG